MPEDRNTDTAPALTNAERQANYRARRQALLAMPLLRYRRPTDRRSRPQRWHDAVAELLALQAEYAAWSDAIPDGLSETPTAEALQAVVELDLSELAAIQPPPWLRTRLIRNEAGNSNAHNRPKFNGR